MKPHALWQTQLAGHRDVVAGEGNGYNLEIIFFPMVGVSHRQSCSGSGSGLKGFKGRSANMLGGIWISQVSQMRMAQNPLVPNWHGKCLSQMVE